MRVLGIGHELDLLDLYQALARRGHDVRVCGVAPAFDDVGRGLVARFEGTTAEALAWVGAAGDDGLIVCENADVGALQDEARRQGRRVVGGSALGDRLEADRAFGQSTLSHLGLPTVATHRFDDYADAARFVALERRRFVCKPNGTCGASHRTYVGRRDDGRDLIAHLELEAARAGPADFVLMEHARGVEIGVGAFFDGQRFLWPANLDWEHKHLFPGDLGELTGEMGTVATWAGAERLFEATLARLGPTLRAADHHGYVNLNLIATEAGLVPLELTMRFGYPGYAVLAAAQTTPWDELLVRVVSARGAGIDVTDHIVVGVVITVPPFPYPYGYELLGKGAAIHVDPSVPRESLHFTEVALRDGRLVTAGATGYLGVVTGTGRPLAEARARAYEAVAGVAVPNLRYREDIGARLLERDARELRRLGWIDDELAARLTAR